MFGQNPIAPIINNDDGRTLHVVKGSPWKTIQGEGPYAGHPATFIRLHGCNLRCTFCDTQFSHPDDPMMDVPTLLAHCMANGAKLVVITGGEPLRQNILPLCIALHDAKFNVQIETAGTLWLDYLNLYADVVVSPKTANIHRHARKYAYAFKYVISGNDEHDGYIPITATQPNTRPQRLATPRDGATVYLSPCDEYDVEKNAANRRLVGRLAMRHNVIAGLQLHKFLELD
jgi:organic radical activating enzyme